MISTWRVKWIVAKMRSVKVSSYVWLVQAVFKSQFTKESEDQTDEQPHHKKGRYQRDVGQDGRDPPSLIVVIFHNKGVVVVIPGISLNWTFRTTVPPLGAKVINLSIFIESCWTPGLHRFLFLFVWKIFSLTSTDPSTSRRESRHLSFLAPKYLKGNTQGLLGSGPL